MLWLQTGSCINGSRVDFGCVLADENIIFLIGGKQGIDGLARVDVWNSHTNKWFLAPTLPIKMKYCRAVLLKRFIYVVGTYIDFYRMNIDNMKGGWQRLPSLKVDGLGCQLLTDGNKYIYRVGDTLSSKTSMHRYDTQNKYWEILPPMIEERDLAAAALVNDKIYVMGGRGGCSVDDILSSMSIFDISTMEWSEGPQLPSKMYGHATVSISDKSLFVCGGRTSYGSLRSMSSCYVFQIENNGWYKLFDAALPEGRSGHSIVSEGRRVFSLGGYSGGFDNNENITDGPIYKVLYKNPSMHLIQTQSIVPVHSSTISNQICSLAKNIDSKTSREWKSFTRISFSRSKTRKQSSGSTMSSSSRESSSN